MRKHTHKEDNREETKQVSLSMGPLPTQKLSCYDNILYRRVLALGKDQSEAQVFPAMRQELDETERLLVFF